MRRARCPADSPNKSSSPPPPRARACLPPVSIFLAKLEFLILAVFPQRYLVSQSIGVSGETPPRHASARLFKKTLSIVLAHDTAVCLWQIQKKTGNESPNRPKLSSRRRERARFVPPLGPRRRHRARSLVVKTLESEPGRHVAGGGRRRVPLQHATRAGSTRSLPAAQKASGRVRIGLPPTTAISISKSHDYSTFQVRFGGRSRERSKDSHRST